MLLEYDLLFNQLKLTGKNVLYIHPYLKGVNLINNDPFFFHTLT
jgi:hypothetical protein